MTDSEQNTGGNSGRFDDIADLFDSDELATLLAEVEPLINAGSAPSAAPLERAAGLGVPVPPQVEPMVNPVGRATQQHMWIDGDEVEFTPQVRPKRRFISTLATRLVLLALVVLLAYNIVPGLQTRLTTQDQLFFNNAVLTAQPVQLSWVRPAFVEELYLDIAKLPDETLPAGTPVARLGLDNLDNKGPDEVELTVPVDSRLASIDASEGSVVAPGSPVATVYDPSLMTVIVTTRASTLDELRRGMTAELTNESLGLTVTGKVDSATPLLGTDQEPTANKLVNVRIEPEPGSLSNVVPGIRFDVQVDTSSVPEDAPRLAYSDQTATPTDD